MLVGWRVRGVDCGVAFFAVCCAVAAAACDVVFAFVLAAVAGGRGGCLLVWREVYVARAGVVVILCLQVLLREVM